MTNYRNDTAYLDYVLYWSAVHNLYVYPAHVHPERGPHTTHVNWGTESSNDPEQIRKWFYERRDPDNFYFCINLKQSNICVLDVDVKPGKVGWQSYSTLTQYYGNFAQNTFTVQTPSGGYHFYFKNWVGFDNSGILGRDIDLPGIVPFPCSNVKGRSNGYRPVTPGFYIDQTPAFCSAFYSAKKFEPVIRERDFILDFNDNTCAFTQSYINRRNLLTIGSSRNPACYQLTNELADAGVPHAVCLQYMKALFPVKCFEYFPERGHFSEEEIEKTVNSVYNGSRQNSLGCRNASLDFENTPLQPAQGVAGRAIEKYESEKLEPLVDLSSKNIGSQFAEGRDPFVYAADGYTEDKIPIVPFLTNVNLPPEPPPVKYIIDNWMPKRTLGGYYGLGAAGKSYTTLHAAFCIATGVPFLGNKINETADVIYFSGEDSPDEIARRVNSVLKNDDFKDYRDHPIPVYIAAGFKEFWPSLKLVTSVDGAMYKTHFYQNLKQMIRNQQAKTNKHMVVIFDTVAKIFSGEENNREAVDNFIENIMLTLMEELDITILMLGHPAKKEGSAYSGSTGWLGGYRWMWHGSKQDDIFSLKLEKSNVSKRMGEVINYKRTDYGLLRSTDFEAHENYVNRSFVPFLHQVTKAAESRPFNVARNASNCILKADIYGERGEPLDEQILERLTQESIQKGLIEVRNNARGTQSYYPTDLLNKAFNFNEYIMGDFRESEDTINVNDEVNNIVMKAIIEKYNAGTPLYPFSSRNRPNIFSMDLKTSNGDTIPEVTLKIAIKKLNEAGKITVEKCAINKQILKPLIGHIT